MTTAMLVSFAVPPPMLGPPPPMGTGRQRADFYKAVAESSGGSALALADHDPLAQDLIFRDLLRQMGAL